MGESCQVTANTPLETQQLALGRKGGRKEKEKWWSLMATTGHGTRPTFWMKFSHTASTTPAASLLLWLQILKTVSSSPSPPLSLDAKTTTRTDCLQSILHSLFNVFGIVDYTICNNYSWHISILCATGFCAVHFLRIREWKWDSHACSGAHIQNGTHAHEWDARAKCANHKLKYVRRADAY